MKNKILILALSLLFITPIAQADVYVKVDANGNAIGGAIMCDAATCGAGSQYSQLTLQLGERYVLQGTGQAGIGNNNPNTQVKVDLQTNEWTVTRQVEVKPIEPIVINNQPVISYTVQTVQTFTPATSPGNDRPAPISTPTPVVSNPVPVVETSTAVAETQTVTVQSRMAIINIPTVTSLTTTTVQLSDVIWGLKNQVVTVKKETAKILVRKKKK
jgi:hypothetical protein